MTPAIRGLDLALAMFAAETQAHIVDEPRSERFTRFLDTFDVDAELAKLDAIGVRFVGRSDPEYPPLLGGITDPPAGLFVRGSADVALLAQPSVAIVGARACSAYGRRVARMLGRELGQPGLVVVSGLARGIDGEAHRGAIDVKGKTVAVLGCGIDYVYPQAHASLLQDITEHGLVVSEYAPGTPPAPWRFPARNRIIAGLCEALIVVEARERSGSLIAADFAKEEGRDVFAVPGEITSPLSAGSNGLLRYTAKALTRVEDVLDAYGITVLRATVGEEQ